MSLASRSDSFDGTIGNSSIDDCKEVTQYSLPSGHIEDLQLTHDDENLELFRQQNNGYSQTSFQNSTNCRQGDDVTFNIEGHVNVNITTNHVNSQGVVTEDDKEKNVSTSPTKYTPEKPPSPRLVILTKRHFKFLFSTIIILLLLCIVTLTTLHFIGGKNKDGNNTTQAPTITPTTTDKPSSSTKRSYCHLFTGEYWGARDSTDEISALKNPVSLVIVKHTDTDICANVAECISAMKELQNYDMDIKGLPDIRYNFVIGADWNVYEGRGWHEQNTQRNDSIDIAFMGNYSDGSPGQIMVGTGPWLIDVGVRSGYLDANVKVVCHNQTENTESPGKYLYKEVVKWKYYSDEIIEN